MDRAKLLALADRVEAAKSADNYLDVEVEVALFEPDSVYSAVRANAAGTKVIYTDRAGHRVTCWAQDWTVGIRKVSAIARLHAIASQEQGEEA